MVKPNAGVIKDKTGKEKMFCQLGMPLLLHHRVNLITLLQEVDVNTFYQVYSTTNPSAQINNAHNCTRLTRGVEQAGEPLLDYLNGVAGDAHVWFVVPIWGNVSKQNTVVLKGYGWMGRAENMISWREPNILPDGPVYNI